MAASDSSAADRNVLRPDAASRARLDCIREMLPALLDAMADAVAVVDRERRMVAANRRFVEAFGGLRVDLLGSACTETAHQPSATGPHERCAICEVLERPETQRRVRQIPGPGGALHRYEATFSPIVGDDGAPHHVVEVWRDVTERTQLEVQLSHSERLASVGMLAAGVAHEINNPLASILAGVEGLSRWLKRGRFDTDSVAEAAETTRLLDEQIERCREITGKLVLLGRSDDTMPGWTDLNRAVRDTLSLLAYELRRRDIEAVTELEADLPQIWAREAAMRGMCMNLMINAVQAMSGGGRLTVKTCRGPEQVGLSIADTGPGIAPEHLEKIWDPFFTTKPVGQGTGLGLSITNGIVTRHGGRIRVESASGRGTRFDIELPIHGTGGEE